MPEMAGKALPGVDTGLRRYGDDFDWFGVFQNVYGGL